MEDKIIDKDELKKQKRREYRARNKDKINDTQREWRLKNYDVIKEQRKIYNKNYRENNKDIIKNCPTNNPEYRKEYRENNREKYRQFNNEYYKTLDGTISALINAAIKRSKLKQLEFNLSREFIKILIIDALDKLGDHITLTKHSPKRASLDRIDSSKGYTEDNVQIIPNWLNCAYSNYNKNDININIIEFGKYLQNKI